MTYLMNKHSFIKIVLPALFIFILGIVCPTVMAEISGSDHDFRSSGWSDGMLCEPCHTPHNGNQSVDTAHLWNHATSTATYQLYASSTLEPLTVSTLSQPGGVSKLCLSCHDGTVAIDSFGGDIGGTIISGTPGESGSRNLGLELRDDHPIGFEWHHQTSSNCTVACHDMAGGTPYNYPVRFYPRGGESTIECSTCHDPHNNSADNNKMLRLTMDGSALCLLCHTDKL